MHFFRQQLQFSLQFELALRIGVRQVPVNEVGDTPSFGEVILRLLHVIQADLCLCLFWSMWAAHERPRGVNRAPLPCKCPGFEGGSEPEKTEVQILYSFLNNWLNFSWH